MIKSGLPTSPTKNMYLHGGKKTNGGGVLFQWNNTTLPTLGSTDRACGWQGTSFRSWNGSGWTEIGGTSGSSTWDSIYTGDKTLTINDATLTFNLTHATGDGLTLSSGAVAGALLQFNNGGTGPDIQGTSDTWAITAAGAATFVGVTTTGDITTTGGAIDWDLIDNNASALSFDATGAAGLLAFVTTNSSEGVTMSGTCTVAGILTASTGITMSDGACALTDNSNAAAGLSFVNDTVTTYGNASDAGPIHFGSATLSTGHLLTLSLDASELAGGSYIRCWEQDGAAAVWTVGEAGLTTIAGSAAGTDALVLTVGDLFLSDTDGSVFESENGTTTLLTLDNKTGVIASDAAVLKLDAGGAIASGGNVLRVEVTGTPASGAIYTEFDFAGMTDTNENIGVLIDAGGKKCVALHVDADPAAGDVVYVHSDAAIAADKALININSAGAIKSGGNALRVDVTGTPASGAIYCEFDFAGLTDTNENVGVLIDAGGKKVQALSVDADPIAGSVALFHTDGATANNKAVVEITSAGTPANAGSNVLRVQFTGTATNTPTLVEVDGASKDVRALSIDADPTALDVVYIHSDAVIADNKALLSLHSAGATAAGSSILRLAQVGTPAAATSYTFEIDNSGSTSTNNPVCVRIDNDDSTGAVIQATSGGAAAPLLDLYSTDTGATGVVIKTTHTSTGSAAASDVVLSLQAWGLDDGDASEEYGRMEVVASSVAAGSETSIMAFYITVGGTSELALAVQEDGILLGTGSAATQLSSNGSQNLTLTTNEAGANEPTIVLTDGATGNITITAGGTSGEIDIASPHLTSSTHSLNGAGAVSLTESITEWTTTGADAGTLADGVEGQHKYITMIADGGDGTLTPTNLEGSNTTITFDAIGDACHLLFTNGSWQVVGNNGCTLG